MTHLPLWKKLSTQKFGPAISLVAASIIERRRRKKPSPTITTASVLIPNIMNVLKGVCGL
jgi:hypothetical protein